MNSKNLIIQNFFFINSDENRIKTTVLRDAKMGLVYFGEASPQYLYWSSSLIPPRQGRAGTVASYNSIFQPEYSLANY